jgi:hypothetical protein
MPKEKLSDRDTAIYLFLAEYKGLAIVQAVSDPIMVTFLQQFLIYLDKHDWLKGMNDG